MNTRAVIAVLLVLGVAYGLVYCAHRAGEWGREAVADVRMVGQPWFEVGRERKSFDLGGARRLTISNPNGNVQVAPGGPGIDVEALRYARGKDEAEARQRAPELILSGKRERQSAFRLSVKGHPRHRSTREDLVVRAPAETEITVQVDAGNIDVEGMLAPVRVQSGAGNTRVERAASGVTINAGTGDVTLAETRGPVSVHLGVGSLTLHAVESAEITAKLGCGNMKVRVARPFTGRMEVKTGTGSIEVAVPAGSRCRVETDVGVGSTDNDLPAAVTAAAAEGYIDAGVGIGDIRLVAAQ